MIGLVSLGNVLPSLRLEVEAPSQLCLELGKRVAHVKRRACHRHQKGVPLVPMWHNVLDTWAGDRNLADTNEVLIKERAVTSSA